MWIVGSSFESKTPSLLESVRNRRVTYSRAGIGVPPGFHDDRWRVIVGNGVDCFARVAAGLRTWQIHEAAGVHVVGGGPMSEGESFLLLTRIVPRVYVGAPVRIVEFSAGAKKLVMTYVTLAGHPERGEETFVLDLADDGVVSLTIAAVSRPAQWSARLGTPVARLVQKRITRRYLNAADALGFPR